MGSFDACVLGERICYLEKEVEALRTQRDALRRSQDNCGLGVEVCDLRAELVAVRRTLEHKERVMEKKEKRITSLWLAIKKQNAVRRSMEKEVAAFRARLRASQNDYGRDVEMRDLRRVLEESKQAHAQKT